VAECPLAAHLIAPPLTDIFHMKPHPKGMQTSKCHLLAPGHEFWL